MARSKGQRELVLLFTCVGRRIELLQAFRAAARRLRVALKIVAADRELTAPGMHAADVALPAPSASDPDYIPVLRSAIREHGVQALIPTIDTDLQVLADHRDALSSDGCTPLIAEPQVIRTCRDKVATYQFLRRAGIDTPETWTPDELLARPTATFPLYLKPRAGSASRFVTLIESAADLEYWLPRVREPIIQEFVAGVEHTLDVYVGLSGSVRCVVPRARWQVRGGEVSKGVVVKDREVMDAGRRVVEALGGSLRGLATLQCIVTPKRRIRFIEINPRFGGGAPLGIAAGADYPAWLIQELLGKQPDIAFDGFRHGLCMLRYDWSVFVPLGEDLRPQINPPLRDWPAFE